ncbi:hypothetical protein [Vibrio spartinae]|uniref:Uncharacterized protein n=1 Tax=Vibrio spartinae TaxID=1918945 RepID=A0A1N6M3H5_9VIBR|nr:hypothetical protein [Vibrio spartinae]QMV14505.1 hypothetical protein Vspart_01761 [Vibrio spartinae]SIO93993.1 hypothetical protein VSP9026_01674 [Vibrio spartinae]
MKVYADELMYKGDMVRGNEAAKKTAMIARLNLFSNNTQDDFKKIPGPPLLTGFHILQFKHTCSGC